MCILITPDLDLKFLPSADPHQAYLLDSPALAKYLGRFQKLIKEFIGRFCVSQFSVPGQICLSVLSVSANPENLEIQSSLKLSCSVQQTLNVT